MIKSYRFLLIGLLAAGNVFAQTEPNKSPATADAAKPPTIHDAAKPAADQSPPPAVAQSPGAPASADQSAKPQIDKNPPPLDPKNMDTSIKPQDDFYLYANGGWIKRNPIPPEFARWGSFNALAEHNNDALHGIEEKASAKKRARAKPAKPLRANCRKSAISTPAG